MNKTARFHPTLPQRLLVSTQGVVEAAVERVSAIVRAKDHKSIIPQPRGVNEKSSN